MTPPPPISKKKSIALMSQCCNAPVTASTKDSFYKLDIKDKDSLVMTIEYICNKCGNVCRVKTKIV